MATLLAWQDKESKVVSSELNDCEDNLLFGTVGPIVNMLQIC
jgi:hypothetical protein